MKTYAIWKDRKVVDYIQLTEEQATHLNGIKDIGVYFGFDSKTNPKKYVTCNKCNGSGYVLFAHDKVKCPVCNGNKTVCR